MKIFKMKLLVTLVIISTYLENVLGDDIKLNPSFERTSVLYGISVQANFQVKKNSSINLCHNELKTFYNAANKKFVWAFKSEYIFYNQYKCNYNTSDKNKKTQIII